MPIWLPCPPRSITALFCRSLSSSTSASLLSLSSSNGRPIFHVTSFLSTTAAPSFQNGGRIITQTRQAHARAKGNPAGKAQKKVFLTPPRTIRRPPPARKAADAPVVYTHTRLKVAIIGRPNVGKSTLFNRLASAVRGRGHDGVANPSPLVFVRSVVDSVPGVTRDPREASAALSDLLMTVVDTPGLEHAIGQCSPLLLEEGYKRKVNKKGRDATAEKQVKLSAATAMCDDPVYRDMYEQMEQKTLEATHDADVIFFVIDAGEGVTIVDKAIADWLHRVVIESKRENIADEDNDNGNEQTKQKTVQSTTKQKHVMLIANKCDLRDAEHRVTEAYELGFEDPIVVSAEQGLGFADLYAELDQLHERLRAARLARVTSGSSLSTEDGREVQSSMTGYNDPWKREADGCGLEPVDNEREDLRASFDDELVIGYSDRPGEEPLRQLIVSIIGRPNVGKSTLLNCLAGEERSLVGPEAGVTRDAVLCEWKFPDEWRHAKHNFGLAANDGKRGRQGQGISFDIPLWLVDTAGVRAQTKLLDEKLEMLSVRTSLRALRHSHVVLMVVDAREPLVAQDSKLMDLVVTYGRSVVLVINKMDKLSKKDEVEYRLWRDGLRYKIDSKLSDVAGLEIVEVSAKDWTDGDGQMKRIFDATLRAWKRWETRIPTAQLNRFVQRFNERVKVGGGTKSKRNRMGTTKFITQRKIRPPMFRLDGSSAVSMNYLRALTNAIRLEFGFHGVPIRVKRPSRQERK